MALRDLRSRSAVEQAMAEYDRLGADAFLHLHGFGRARSYLLIHGGREYDSKAIAGVAHGYERPHEGPLASADFSGGVQGAAGVLRNLGFEVPGPEVSPVRAAPPRGVITQRSPEGGPAEVGPAYAASDLASDVVLVGCVKGKGPRPAPARDLYTSPLFVKRRAYADASGKPWFILSAMHGLIRPESVTAPYDMALGDQSSAYLKEWGQRTHHQLTEALGDLAPLTFEFHAGASYVTPLAPLLRSAGAGVLTPLTGLSMGPQLAWYSTARPPPPAVLVAPISLGLLGDEALALAPGPFPWGRSDLESAGLYSWWVDTEGSHVFTSALGERVTAGLVYLGQAGADSSVAALPSGATLRSRIGGQHLGGNPTSSTWRLTLHALLRDELRLDELSAAEAGRAVTGWMGEHLRLSVLPVGRGRDLHRLEAKALAQFDPPLNLAGMPMTPVRASLRRLRAALRRAPLKN